MKKSMYLGLIVIVIFGGLLFAGCSSKANNKKEDNIKILTDCLNKTKTVDSLEAEVTSKTEANGIPFEFKINMKLEDIKNNPKSYVVSNIGDQKQEFYLSDNNGSPVMYIKNGSGKFIKTVDSQQQGGLDFMKSLNAYIEIIKENSDLVLKVYDNIYSMDIPNEKTKEIYSRISGNKGSDKVSNLNIEFVIGKDKYLEYFNLETSVEVTDANNVTSNNTVNMSTKYFNYNKKFNIMLPNVAE